jgi:hypothetical protein
VDQLHTGHDALGVEEALEADPRGFSPSGDLVRRYCSGRASANLDGVFPTVIEPVIHAHEAHSGMGGLEAIQGNYSWLAAALYQQSGRGTPIDRLL